jgi:hypothetical protein
MDKLLHLAVELIEIDLGKEAFLLRILGALLPPIWGIEKDQVAPLGPLGKALGDIVPGLYRAGLA